ncbi:DUF547 domain-containing protein [Halocola ammonii]
MLKTKMILAALFISAFSFMNLARAEDDSNQMHQVWDELLQKYVSNDGMVDYSGFKNDPRFSRYITVLQKMTPQSDWSDEEKMAYWINAYNAFAIKLVTENHPLKSIMDLEKPFEKKFIKIGSRTFSLNEIENEMLRKPFGDPRIHFGVNCASISCPKLSNRAFTAENIDQQLEKLTTEFVNNSEKNRITSNAVAVSKIFEWYKEDFTKNGSLIDWLNKYSKTEISADASVSYKEYDWNLNGK